jgi:DNA sulfur modification protein DndC
VKTLFESQRDSLADALAMTEASLCAYGERRHWCVAFSGGKDSSATLAAVVYLIDSGRVPRPQSLTVLYADTRLELPNLQSAAYGMLDAARARGLATEVVYPLLDKRFYVMMFGRGVPPSHSGFRWCTGALKVDPMGAAMQAMRDRTGDKLLLITGMRIGESANRDKRIALSCGRNGGECGQGWYEETTPAEVADVLSPLLHWRTCHVWDWLRHGLADHAVNPHPEFSPEWRAWIKQRARRLPCHGFDCRMVCEVYDAGFEDSELEALNRTGCLVCPVASRDQALERTVRKPEWAYLAPLQRLRPLYDDLTAAHSRLRKNAERTAGGALSANPMRLGPLTMPARVAGLIEVLAIQDEVNESARRHSRPEVSLINAEELARIRELIAAGTWPDKWTGDEPHGDALLPITYRDGTVQRMLFATEGA